MFEELAWAETHEGTLTLRRRRELSRDVDVYEVKLGDEYLMSSLFTVAEVELARLGLAAIDGTDLDVVVGGLGLGYTARAALDDDRIRSLVIIEALEPVIDWHQRGLVPGSDALTGDPRTRLFHGDFFALAAGPDGFVPDEAGRNVDAILVDIDHSPRHVLHPSHADFYTVEGLGRVASHLRPAGVFALWSDDPPDPDFETALDAVFAERWSHVVPFANFLTGGESTNTVYVAVSPVGSDTERL